jgi:hypothetical protein
MMKTKILIVLVFVALALGAVCVIQWGRSQAARQRLAALQEALQAETESRAAQEDKVHLLETQRARLGRDVDQFTRLVKDLRASESQQASNLARVAGQGAATTNAETSQPESEKGGLLGGKGMGDMLSKMMKDPTMKEMIRSQQKIMAQKMYGPLVKDLNLTPEQKDRFLELVLDHQMAAVDQAGALFGGGDAGKTEAAQNFKDKQTELDANIKALVGDEKFTHYEEYKKTMADRMVLDQFQQQLDGSGAALQDPQLKSLLQVMKEERDKVPAVLPDKGAEASADFGKLLTDENLQKQFQWQEDLNRRVQDRAGQVLNPQQLKELTDFQAQQLNLQKVGMKMAREMFGTGKTPATR